MAHQLSMLPSQQMRLEQRLTPQLIQSMEILQLPLLALEARVREELEQNPVLEEVELEARPEPAAAKDEPPHTEQNQAEAESFQRLDTLSRELDLDPGDLPYGRGGSAPSGERDAKLDAMANTASRGESLKDQLLHQWAMVEAGDDVRQAGIVLIEWMDDDGYLRTDADHHPQGEKDEDAEEAWPLIIKRPDDQKKRLMEEIAFSRTPPIQLSVLQEALKLVQTLEPRGVGARDLTECLLIQIRGSENGEALCEELINKHLVNLARNNFPLVAKATGRTIDEIKAALKKIGKLNHHPGLLVRSTEVPHIAPDIIVDYADEGDGYTVRLAKGSAPRLRISPHYREMLHDKTSDQLAREFIKKRLESASTIIEAIAYRRQRLLSLAQIILERQREFFDFGPQFLKVMRMREVAEELECDPSTISRTVDGKYIQTPRGLYPLRQFFSGGTTDARGESVSWNSLKARVKQIIDAEDKSSPLTDDEITKRLSEETGTPIARRTVAKYRGQLGIPPNRERKAY